MPQLTPSDVDLFIALASAMILPVGMALRRAPAGESPRERQLRLAGYRALLAAATGSCAYAFIPYALHIGARQYGELQSVVRGLAWFVGLIGAGAAAFSAWNVLRAFSAAAAWFGARRDGERPDGDHDGLI